MPNKLKGEIPLKLSDGREFVLVAGIEAMIEAEGLYGKPGAQIAADAAAGYMGAIRALFYGMLKRKHPDITPSDAGDLLSNHMDEVGAAMEASTEAASPPKSEGKEGANPPSGRRGKPSGRSGAKPA